MNDISIIKYNNSPTGMLVFEKINELILNTSLYMKPK